MPAAGAWGGVETRSPSGYDDAVGKALAVEWKAVAIQALRQRVTYILVCPCGERVARFAADAQA